jgi:hypothetical protein
MARSTICTFSGDTTPSRWSAASFGGKGSSPSPAIEVRAPSAAAAWTRAAASPWESCSTRTKNWIMVEEQYFRGRSLASPWAIRP